MKAAKLAATLLLVYVGIVVVFELVGSFYQPTNVGVPLLVITTTAEDGTSNDRILAHLESQGQLFVSANHWPRAWYYRALENPNVQVTLEGEKADYLAVPASEEELVRLHAESTFPFVVRFLSGFAPRAFLRLDPRASSEEPTAADLEAGFATFLEALARSEQAIRKSPSFASDAERAGAYQHLARSIKVSIEAGVLQDPDFPYFRIIDFWARQGGDNPDQRYAFSPVRGGEVYRVWGRLGSARRIELQLYAGQPWAGTGRSAGYLAFEDIDIAPDGTFSIRVGGEQTDGTWLANPPDAMTLFARQIYDEWNAADPGEVHIDRVGWEGARKPVAVAAQVALQLRTAAAMLEKAATTWPTFVQRRYVGAGQANTMSGLVDTYKLGGVKGRWMAGGHFDLPPGKVLLIETWPTTAAYQAIQLTDMWFASLEYANQVSSLTTSQSIKAPNGAYYSVVAREDPGYANWLDTGGLDRGVLLLRYDGVSGDVPKAQHPSAKLVDASALPDLIPGYARATQAQRKEMRAARRRHVQIRNHR